MLIHEWGNTKNPMKSSWKVRVSSVREDFEVEVGDLNEE
jgi:hypothetical protein